MTYLEAKEVVMVYGKHKDKKLCRLPSFYLDWLIKNWSDSRVREAAQLVKASRSHELGQKTAFPLFKQRSKPAKVEREPVKHEFFGKLREEMDQMPPDLF